MNLRKYKLIKIDNSYYERLPEDTIILKKYMFITKRKSRAFVCANSIGLSIKEAKETFPSIDCVLRRVQ